MMILILALTIIITIILYKITDEEWVIGLSIVLIIIEVIIGLIIVSEIVNGRVINDKIKMYQLENTIIETQIETTVKEYMKFEKETFTELKTKESYITLVTLYPDLKTNELIKKELDIYIANNAKVKELKETKINLSNAKWWIWFGR